MNTMDETKISYEMVTKELSVFIFQRVTFNAVPFIYSFKKFHNTSC